MGTFSLDFAKFKDKSEKQLDKAIRVTALNLYGSIILDSPTDSGRFRANNTISIDNESNVSLIKYDNANIKRGQDSNTYAENVEKFNKAKVGRYIFIQNNLDYASDLEYGTITTSPETLKTIKGFSKQAPKGIYRINILRFNKFLTEAVKETKK